MERMLLLALLSLCMGCEPQKTNEPPRRPNVILILADDQGWGDLSFHGNTNLKTPNIDALAKEGVSFNHFYVQPVCSPTRAELLTGRYFTRLGVYSTSAGGERLNLGETTMAEVFRKAGYATAAYGKWHNGTQPPYHPNSRGFDDFYGFASGHWGNYFDPQLEHNGRLIKGEGYLPDDLTRKALSFIEQHKEAPFFLYLPLNTPHSPMQVPDRFWNRFSDKRLEMFYRDSLQENLNFTRAALAMVENIDHNLGRISSKLKDLKLEEHTIVVYLSDNGPNGWRWNGGMRGRKGSTDEGGVRSPLFIRWKDSIKAGRQVSRIASAIDLLPTLAGLTGISTETEKPLDGLSLAPLIFKENPEWPERLVFNHWNGKTSVRSQHYRLDHLDRLYDMKQDAGQTTDISGREAEISGTLKTAKTKWLENTVKTMKDTIRPFTLGYPGAEITQLPARDGTAHGNIRRSNRYPNCSYFTNWKHSDDRISWPVEVLTEGEYKVTLYYSCKPENVGARIELSFADRRLVKEVSVAHDPPLKGMEHDRDPRIESYVKDFKPLLLGDIFLKKGRGTLSLKALEIPGDEAIEVRLLLFRKLD